MERKLLKRVLIKLARAQRALLDLECAAVDYESYCQRIRKCPVVERIGNVLRVEFRRSRKTAREPEGKSG